MLEESYLVFPILHLDLFFLVEAATEATVKRLLKLLWKRLDLHSHGPLIEE